jgi:hypothetical protein
MEERYNRFTEYDFVHSSAWQSYLEALYFNPTLAQVIKLKRKWYKANVDPEFDINFDPSAATPPPPQQSYQQYNPTGSRTGSANTLGLIECVLFAMILPAIAFEKAAHFALAAFVCGFLSNYGVPRLNSEYWRTAVFSDDLHSVVFCFIFFMYPSLGLWLLPIAIGGVSRLGEILNIHPKVPAFLKPLARAVHMKKYELDMQKAKVEIGLGFALLVLGLVGSGSLMFAFLYWNFMRMKYMVNSYTAAAFSSLRLAGDSYIRRAPSLVQTAWEKLKAGCDALTAPQQASTCEVM